MVAAASADILDISFHREGRTGNAGSCVLRTNSRCSAFSEH